MIAISQLGKRVAVLIEVMIIGFAPEVLTPDMNIEVEIKSNAPCIVAPVIK